MVRKAAPQTYKQKRAADEQKRVAMDAVAIDKRREEILSAADGNAIITHTTAIVAGVEHADIRVIAAQTEHAELHTNFGPFFLIFRSAAAVHGFISAFAAVRPLMFEVEQQLPTPPTAHRHSFALATLAVVYLGAPTYRIERANRWSEARRRKIHWIELVMGPVTWRIIEHVAYEELMEEFGRLHRTAVGAFIDGQGYVSDPTVTLDAFDRVDRTRPTPVAKRVGPQN